MYTKEFELENEHEEMRGELVSGQESARGMLGVE